MPGRELLILLGGTAVLAPRAAGAQEPGRVYRLWNLHQAPRDAPHHLALYQALRQFGYVEDQNLQVDRGGYGLRLDQLAAHAAEVVDARVDVILSGGGSAVSAALAATKTIPILALADDMVSRDSCAPWPSLAAT